MRPALVPVSTVEETVGAVERHFHRIYDELAVWSDTLVELFSAGPVTAAMASTAIIGRALAFLDGPHSLVGGGFVAARDALADRPLYLAWWQGDNRALLAEPSGPATEVFDYTRRPWFTVPERTGRRHLTGPYVDFVCTDEYTVTATAPVTVDGRMVGVVGADTLVETLERMLLPGLRASGATLVSEHGRAVVSADPHIGPGDRVGPGTTYACAGLPLSVVVP
ncbi:MAG: cache domain-containing protein [Nocardioides sp.]|uniref:cache domain-containing protein n=1 Tax=Nocardioides sp. TaxID=35761 RepID=UPI0039E5467E